jgi:hypothetical protein
MNLMIGLLDNYIGSSKTIENTNKDNKIKLVKLTIYNFFDYMINKTQTQTQTQTKIKLNLVNNPDNLDNTYYPNNPDNTDKEFLEKLASDFDKILNWSDNEIIEMLQIIFTNEKIVGIIKNIYDIDNISSALSCDSNILLYCDLYHLTNLDQDSLAITINDKYKEYLKIIRNQNDQNDQNHPNHPNNNWIVNNTLMPKELDKIIKITAYNILLNKYTKKIYDKFYLIQLIKKQTQQTQPSNKIVVKNDNRFVYTFKKICTQTDLDWKYDYNSDEFVKMIKYIFIKKSNRFEKYNNFILDDYDNFKKLNKTNVKNNEIFDEEFEKFNPDRKISNYNQLDIQTQFDFLDLYKLLDLNIDMKIAKIKEHLNLKEEKIQIENDLEKFVGYQILSNKKTKKIYDNYWLDFYIDNWDILEPNIGNNDCPEKKSNSKMNLEQIDLVYSKLFNPDTKITETKLNSDNVTKLIDKYNEESKAQGIFMDASPEKIQEANQRWKYFNKRQDHNSNCFKLDLKLKTMIATRDSLQYDYNIFYKINELINKNKIIPSDLFEYNAWKNNKTNVLSVSHSNTVNFSSVDDFKYDIFHNYFDIESFDIDDFNIWKNTNIKLSKKINEQDYLDMIAQRKKYDEEISNIYANNYNLAKFYLNQK